MNSEQERHNVDRNYRALHGGYDLRYFRVQLKETDLAIGVDKASYTDSLLVWCEREVLRLRGALETYIRLHPEFRSSFVPLPLLPGAPPLVLAMSRAAYQTGVGPMAAVAGAIAQEVGRGMGNKVRDVIVENGGDIYMNSAIDRLIALYAGTSHFSHKIALQVAAAECPLGICTSSGTVGPSVSLGKADAVVIKASDAALADAAATGAANLIQSEQDLMRAVDYVQHIPGINGILAVKGDKLAAWGSIEIVAI